MQRIFLIESLNLFELKHFGSYIRLLYTYLIDEYSPIFKAGTY